MAVFKRKVYVEVSETGLTFLFPPKKENDPWGARFVALPAGDFDEAEIATLLAGEAKVRTIWPISDVFIFANTRKSVIRIARITPTDVQPGETELWALIKPCFPVGHKMDETTHLFSGAIFNNPDSIPEEKVDTTTTYFEKYQENDTCIIAAALPAYVANWITRSVLHLTGSALSLRRLDVVENLIFQYYALKTLEPFWVALPQNVGLRILHIANGKPVGVEMLGHKPGLREEHVLRILGSFKENIFPVRLVFLNVDEDIADWGWLVELLEDRGVATEIEDYHFLRYLSD